ncbi:MAG: sulfurtransferase [Oligoflexales bacterium]|nr:sulfurtransferase [Oligoflexales bacterium]
MINSENLPKIFDCRFKLDDPNWGENQYKEGHIPGAIYCHLELHLSGPIKPGTTGRHPLPEIDDFTGQLKKWGLDKQSPVIIYDQGPGAFASRLWWMLRSLGFTSVSVLDGGYAKWMGEGRKVGKDIVQPQEASTAIKGDWSKLVSAKEILSNRENMVLIDARAPERFSGKVEPIDRVGGHIPGAINLPFSQNLDSMGCFKDSKGLAERFREVANKKLAIVCYCGSGVTAAHNILAMAHAGLDNVQLYPGSWSEWICDRNRPVATGD